MRGYCKEWSKSLEIRTVISDWGKSSLNVSWKKAQTRTVICIFTFYKGSTLFVLRILFTTELTTKSFYKLCMPIWHMTYTYVIYACCISKTVAISVWFSSHSAFARLHLEYWAQFWASQCKEGIESSGGWLRWLGVGLQDIQEKDVEAGFVQPGEKKAKEASICCLPLPSWWLQRGCSKTLPGGAQWKDKRRQPQVTAREIPAGCKKTSFFSFRFCESGSALEQGSREAVEPLSSEILKIQPNKARSNLI